jgi:hypothetical protein
MILLVFLWGYVVHWAILLRGMVHHCRCQYLVGTTGLCRVSFCTPFVFRAPQASTVSSSERLDPPRPHAGFSFVGDSETNGQTCLDMWMCGSCHAAHQQDADTTVCLDWTVSHWEIPRQVGPMGLSGAVFLLLTVRFQLIQDATIWDSILWSQMTTWSELLS